MDPYGSTDLRFSQTPRPR